MTSTDSSNGASSRVIAIEGLRKHYRGGRARGGPVRALDGLTLDVEPGPVGLLGPNGAGKTTLLRLLLGLLRPDGGRAAIAGHDPSTRAGRVAIRRSVGYMPEGDCLLPGMSAVQLVATLGRVTGLSKPDAMTRTHEVLDYVGLEEQRYRDIEEYSTGMKQRLKLAQALVHDPELLLLDEPTNGLDPRGRRHMLALVHDLGHAQQKNVLLCSHLLADVERTCDRVVVLHRGRVVETGEIAEMTRGDGLSVRLRIDGDAGQFAAALGRRGLEHVSDGPFGFRVTLSGNGDGADEVFAAALEAEAVVESLEPVRSSLQDVFLRVLAEAGS